MFKKFKVLSCTAVALALALVTVASSGSAPCPIVAYQPELPQRD